MHPNVLWLCAVADKTHTNFKFITMKTSTKPNENTAENGNKSKPLLAEADFSEQKNGYFTTEKQPLIRFKIVKDIDPIFGGEYWDYRFEIFQRPYFWNLLGSKKWDMSVQTNGFTEGLSFSHYLLGFR